MIVRSAPITLRVAALVLLAVVGTTAANRATAQYVYNPVIDLGTGYGSVAVGTAIAPGGLAVGYFKPSVTSANTQAFRWTVNEFNSLSALPNYATSAAYAANRSGQVVGVSCAADGIACRATLWNDEAPLDLGYVGQRGGAFAIDYAGNAAGSVLSPLDGAQHATLWKGLAASALPRLSGETSSVALALIPDPLPGVGEDVVGTTTLGTGSGAETRATLWHASSGALDLGIPHSAATAIESLGTETGPIIGGYFTVPGKSSQHGFTYNRGVITEYGTLGGANSRINGFKRDVGFVLGTADDAAGRRTAVFWDSAGNITDLNTLVPPGTPHLSEAIGEDDLGQIIAVSDDTSNRPLRALVLHFINYPQPLVGPAFSPAPGLYPANAPLTVTMSTPSRISYPGGSDPAPIRYTLDGTAPGFYGPLVYQSPIELTSTTLIRAATYAGIADFSRPESRALYTLVPTFTGQEVVLDGSIAAVGTLGVATVGGGIDGGGYAYAADLLGNSVTWDNTVFSLSTPRLPAVADSTINLPATHASAIKLLATAVRGNRPDQSFVVHYTDGTSTRLPVSLSDWVTAQNYAGETVVRRMDYRVSPQGTASYGPVNLYGYSLPTDPGKTLKSLTTPPTPYVVVLSAMATAPTAGAPQHADLSGAADVQAAGTPGAAIMGGGLDGAGNAYSAASLPRSLNWAGTSFTLGAAGAPDAVSQATLKLPGVKAGVLDLLATAVNGRQAAQPFTITYSDGSQLVVPLTLSDWQTPSGAAREFIAASFPSALNAAGAARPGPYYLYGYSIPLDASKTLVSLGLPNNRNVVLLAANVATTNAIVPVQQLPLAAQSTRSAIATAGTPPTDGGLDGLGNAYSSAYLGDSLVWGGVPFIVPAPNGVSEVPLTLPTPGTYSAVDILAADTRGNRINQPFDVLYTDGTQVRTLQNMSDWSTPQGYPGESLALVMPARIDAGGKVLKKPTYLYGYSIALDQTRQVQAITLPGSPYVTILGLTLVP